MSMALNSTQVSPSALTKDTQSKHQPDQQLHEVGKYYEHINLVRLEDHSGFLLNWLNHRRPWVQKPTCIEGCGPRLQCPQKPR